MMVNEFFKYKGYRNFLYHIRDNYPIITFAKMSSSSNGILLRHDVDLSIERAYSLALVERMCGVKSTFFIMTTSYMYNPLAEENKRMLRRMVVCDFEIELHFNPSIYNRGCLEEAVSKEVDILQFITGKVVNSISLHNPNFHGIYVLFDNYINTYDRSMFSDALYMSDSCMDFKGEDPYEFVKKAKDSIVQLALHPCYYSGDSSDPH